MAGATNIEKMICNGNRQKRRRNPIAQINKALSQVGPIPGGKEVVVQYTSDIISDGKFYTGVLILARFLLFAVF